MSYVLFNTSCARSRAALWGVLIGIGWTLVVAAVAQSPPPATATALELELPAADPGRVDLEDAPPGTKTLLAALLMEQLPANYEDTKKWGQTRKRWDGLHVKMDGLKVKTKRRWKEVNHGTWKRYTVTLVDPEEHLDARIVNLQKVKPGTVGMDLVLGARLNVYGRLQEWNNGVRLFSVSSEAIADVELTVRLQVATSLDATKFPPDVVVNPTAQSAQVDLQSFRLKRISKADGPIVHELGDVLEDVVREKLAQRNEKLVHKINRQIDKQRDDLRLSVHDLVKYKWLGIQPAKQSPNRES